jgi:putative membrane protein
MSGGVEQLDTGPAQLISGIGQLQAGVKTLHDGLTEALAQVPNLSVEQQGDMVAFTTDPVDIVTDNQGLPIGYAAGLAPFFIALRAWVGAYILYIVGEPLNKKALLCGTGPLHIALGGYLVPLCLASLQMIVVFCGACLITSFMPAMPLPMLLFMILMSCAYLAIIPFLVVAFNKVGLFIVLVLLVLQITTAGGTFPWQTMPVPAQFIHRLTPMTYALDGIRQLIYGGNMTLLLNDCLILLGWLVVFFWTDRCLFLSQQGVFAQRHRRVHQNILRGTRQAGWSAVLRRELPCEVQAGCSAARSEQLQGIAGRL